MPIAADPPAQMSAENAVSRIAYTSCVKKSRPSASVPSRWCRRQRGLRTGDELNELLAGVVRGDLAGECADEDEHDEEGQRGDAERTAAEASRRLTPRPAPADGKGVGTDLRHAADARTHKVADGARTHDHRDHNPELYQLSYRHREAATAYRLASWPDSRRTARSSSR